MVVVSFAPSFAPFLFVIFMRRLRKVWIWRVKGLSDESTRALRPLLSRRGGPSFHYSCGLVWSEVR